jgi:predicted DNA-binding protein (MmcQ/YjbR family)
MLIGIQTIREYCARFKGNSESFPFDDQSLCFKVGEKIYAILGLDQSPLRINLKCDPEYAIELRASYAGIIPGYHMSKKHWNTVILDDQIPNELLWKLIDDSYHLVYQSLTKAQKLAIETSN